MIIQNIEGINYSYFHKGIKPSSLRCNRNIQDTVIFKHHRVNLILTLTSVERFDLLLSLIYFILGRYTYFTCKIVWSINSLLPLAKYCLKLICEYILCRGTINEYFSN